MTDDYGNMWPTERYTLQTDVWIMQHVPIVVESPRDVDRSLRITWSERPDVTITLIGEPDVWTWTVLGPNVNQTIVLKRAKMLIRGGDHL